jgi:hypothetical protein
MLIHIPCVEHMGLAVWNTPCSKKPKAHSEIKRGLSHCRVGQRDSHSVILGGAVEDILMGKPWEFKHCKPPRSCDTNLTTEI